MVTKNHEAPLRLFHDDPVAPALIIKDKFGVSIDTYVRARTESEALLEDKRIFPYGSPLLEKPSAKMKRRAKPRGGPPQPVTT